jgi:hypothetical protein
MDYEGALIRYAEWLNELLVRFAVSQLALATITEKDPLLGLPYFICYGRVFQLIVRIWSGCYAAAGRFGLSELECDFLFRWFLLGGVLDNDEFQATLSLAVRFCSQANIPQSGWVALYEFFKFATQQGRIEQPWGFNCALWIRGHRLQ